MHKIESRADIASRIAYRFNSVNPTSTALLVIDMQAGFLREGFTYMLEGALDIVASINILATKLRKAGGLVVFNRHTVTTETERAIPSWQLESPIVNSLAAEFPAGSEAHAVDEAMDVAVTDIVIDKYRYSALSEHSSDLPNILRTRSIDTVTVTGVATNFCCESTARDAFMMGLRTFFIEDATGAANNKEHNATLANMAMAFADVRSTPDMAALL
jgi:ureidoacrylate peracid hydrolase